MYHQHERNIFHRRPIFFFFFFLLTMEGLLDYSLKLQDTKLKESTNLIVGREKGGGEKNVNWYQVNQNKK